MGGECREAELAVVEGWRCRPRIRLRDLALFSNAFTVPSLSISLEADAAGDLRADSSREQPADPSTFSVSKRQKLAVAANAEGQNHGQPDGFYSVQKRKLSAECSSADNVPSRLLEVSSVPWVIIGRLHLWNRHSCLHSSAFGGDCFAIADDTAVACCLLTTVNPALLGRDVVITSFNSIPCRGEGSSTNVAVVGECVAVFVEIHELCAWEGTPSLQTFPSFCISPVSAAVRNDVLETPPVKSELGKPRLGLWGFLQCLSPSFVLPCKNSNGISTGLGESSTKVLFTGKRHHRNKLLDEQSMRGFFVELKTCIHSPSCRPVDIHRDHPPTTNDTSEVAQNAVHIYFAGPVGAWRPVLLAAIGKCISITGLRKKMISIGPNNRYFIFAATRTTLVTFVLPGVPNVCKRPNNEQQGVRCDSQHPKIVRQNLSVDLETYKKCKRLGSYIGVVTSVHFKGRLLELDEHVQLLLTHQQHAVLHGLRVGATLFVQDVHIIFVRSCWKNCILFGACFRSTVKVASFSSLDTSLPFHPAPESYFVKKIQHHPFVETFWLLQALTNFKDKLPHLYSENKLFDSKRYGGLIRDYIQNHSASVSRDGVKEFLSHDESCCLGETDRSKSFLQIPSFHEFDKFVKDSWYDPSSFIWQGQRKQLLWSWKNTRHNGESFIRSMISSDEMHVLLLGWLQSQVSKSSGMLQLTDATNQINAIIPDAHCPSLLHHVYEVAKFTLVFEGTCNFSSQSSEAKISSLRGLATCHSYYVVFHIKDASPFSAFGFDRIHASVHDHSRRILQPGRYAVIMITHKYPLKRKMSEPKGVAELSFCAEAVGIPATLFVEASTNSSSNAEPDCRWKQIIHGSISHQLHSGSPICGEGNTTVSSNCQAYLELENLSLLDSEVERLQQKKILLEFSTDCTEYNEFLQLGHCYAYYDPMPFNQSKQDARKVRQWAKEHNKSMIVSISSGRALRSLCFVSQRSRCQLLQPDEHMQQMNSPCQSILVKSTSNDRDLDECHGLRFAASKDCTSLMCSFMAYLSEFKTQFSPSVQSVREVLDKALFYGCNQMESAEVCIEGLLISFYGVIRSKSDIMSCGAHSLNSTFSLEVKDLHGPEVVLVTLDTSKFVIPSSLGPGTVASFHRVILKRSSNGILLLQCIPTTLIIVHMINEWMPGVHGKRKSLELALPFKLEEHDGNLSAIKEHCLLFELPGLSCQTGLAIHCRVVAVERLVVKWHGSTSDNKMHHLDDMHNLYNINFCMGCFIIDDGSCLAECWAYGSWVVAALLGLHSRGKQDEYMQDKLPTHGSRKANHDLCHVTRKHGHVVYENHCSEDCTKTSQTMDGDKGEPLSEAEHFVVDTFVTRACHRGPLLLICDIIREDKHLDYEKATLVEAGQLLHTLVEPKVKLVAKFVEPSLYAREAERLCVELELALNRTSF